MAITINGNGTITGVSVGGLPDGIVDTDMIAASAVTPAKSTITGGKVLQIVQNATTTRLQTTSGTFVATYGVVTITPTAASSKILIQFAGIANTEAANRGVFLTVYRSINSGTAVNIAPQGSNFSGGENNNHGFTGNIRGSGARLQAPFFINYLDSPSYSVGNAIEYKLYARSANNGETIEVSGSNNAEPQINMATEIAA